jgi:hypothetical protein
MMRTLGLLLASVALAAAQSPAPSPKEVTVMIQAPNDYLSDFVKLYQHLSGRKVWLDAELPFDKHISIFRRDPMTRPQAIALIRETLQREGVTIREVGDSEAFVSRAAP